VAAAVARQLDIPAGEVGAGCPEEAEAEAGARFTCDVTVDGHPVDGIVTFSTDAAFTVELAAEVIPNDVLEAEVRAELARRFVGIDVASVDCGGDSVVVITTGQIVQCQAEDTTGGEAVAEIGLDADGNAVVQSVTDPNAPLPG
jgi:hypothetical protein